MSGALAVLALITDSGVRRHGSGGGGWWPSGQIHRRLFIGRNRDVDHWRWFDQCNGIGGTSSFGSHCSATGGNSGDNNTANEGSGAIYGVGGMGSNGDKNQRGGRWCWVVTQAVLIPVAVAVDLLLPPTERLLDIEGGNAVSSYAGCGGGGIGGVGATVITSAPAVAEA